MLSIEKLGFFAICFWNAILFAKVNYHSSSFFTRTRVYINDFFFTKKKEKKSKIFLGILPRFTVIRNEQNLHVFGYIIFKKGER